jgi:hypothetical protein
MSFMARKWPRNYRMCPGKDKIGFNGAGCGAVVVVLGVLGNLIFGEKAGVLQASRISSGIWPPPNAIVPERGVLDRQDSVELHLCKSHARKVSATRMMTVVVVFISVSLGNKSIATGNLPECGKVDPASSPLAARNVWCGVLPGACGLSRRTGEMLATRCQLAQLHG